MGLLIDIYRYQTVTDPSAVKRAGVVAAYVKGTDGGGRAIVPADNQVRQMQSVGIPAGLYHYAQLRPEPEEQADVLCREVDRLMAYGLPPALDLEDPWPASRSTRPFAERFCRRVRSNGFPVILYGNTTMLDAIDAETMDVDGIWQANYGTNDGRRWPLPNRPWRTLIHQYTSVGTVPGISGRVDLNEILGPVPGLNGGDLMLDAEDLRKVTDDTRVQVFDQKGNPITGYKVSLGEILGRNNQYSYGAAKASSELQAAFTNFAGIVTGELAGLKEAVAKLAEGQDITAAEIEEAAARGAQRGVESATVDVDITVAGRPQPEPTP